MYVSSINHSEKHINSMMKVSARAAQRVYGCVFYTVRKKGPRVFNSQLNCVCTVIAEVRVKIINLNLFGVSLLSYPKFNKRIKKCRELVLDGSSDTKWIFARAI
jgi:hypothetical protein